MKKVFLLLASALMGVASFAQTWTFDDANNKIEVDYNEFGEEDLYGTSIQWQAGNQGALLDAVEEATGVAAWVPEVGQAFFIKITGTASNTGKLQMAIVDERAVAEYYSALSSTYPEVQVVKGEPFVLEGVIFLDNVTKAQSGAEVEGGLTAAGLVLAFKYAGTSEDEDFNSFGPFTISDATMEVVFDDAATNKGIYYRTLNANNVMLVQNKSKDYSGDIIIPSTVTIAGNTYSVTEIGRTAFSNRSDLTSVTIPNSVTSIGNGAFSYCTGLTTLIIKNSTCSIEGDLYTCTALTEYSGPASPFNKYNSSESGRYSTLLEKITLTSGTIDRNGLDYINLSYRTLQEIDLSGIENTEIPDMAFNNCYKLEKVTLPAQLESVGYKSFAGCTALEGISLPASVTKIDNSAFEDCRSMSKIVFDGSELKASTSNLETIGKWAFYNCHNLQSLEIPEGVTSIGDAAFYGCTYLQNLELPSTLKSMGDNTFALCENLKSMTIFAENPPSLFEKSFYNVDHTIPVSVPESSLKAYAETEYWSEFIHYKSLDEEGGEQGGEQGGEEGGSTAVSEVSNATAVTIANGQILVNGEAPAFVVTVSGKKTANANLKSGVYFVVADGNSVSVVVR